MKKLRRILEGLLPVLFISITACAIGWKSAKADSANQLFQDWLRVDNAVNPIAYQTAYRLRNTLVYQFAYDNKNIEIKAAMTGMLSLRDDHLILSFEDGIGRHITLLYGTFIRASAFEVMGELPRQVKAGEVIASLVTDGWSRPHILLDADCNNVVLEPPVSFPELPEDQEGFFGAF